MDALGLLDSGLASCRVGGLLGRIDTARVHCLLPASTTAVPQSRIHAAALRTWTELRAIVLTAIWHSRLDLLFKRELRRVAARHKAVRCIKTKLRHLLFLHVPTLSPWVLDVGGGVAKENPIVKLIWRKFASLIKR
jgi:hypothetical protein